MAPQTFSAYKPIKELQATGKGNKRRNLLRHTGPKSEKKNTLNRHQPFWEHYFTENYLLGRFWWHALFVNPQQNMRRIALRLKNPRLLTSNTTSPSNRKPNKYYVCSKGMNYFITITSCQLVTIEKESMKANSKPWTKSNLGLTLKKLKFCEFVL